MRRIVKTRSNRGPIDALSYFVARFVQVVARAHEEEEAKEEEGRT